MWRHIICVHNRLSIIDRLVIGVIESLVLIFSTNISDSISICAIFTFVEIIFEAMCDGAIIIECIGSNAISCIHAMSKNNEIIMVLEKKDQHANINANQFIQSLSTKLKMTFKLSNVAQNVQTNRDSIKSFKLPNKKKMSYKFSSNKLWYSGKSGSFVWWADAQCKQFNFGLIILKVKYNPESAIDEIDFDDENEIKTSVRDFRPKYKPNDTLSNDKNWTQQQTQYATQCKGSFQMLVDQSIQFHGNFWTGILPNATSRRIDHFVEVYTSESIQWFRCKKNLDPKQSAVKATDEVHQMLWNSMFHPGDEKEINIKNLYIKQIWFMQLYCYKMDDVDVKRSAPISTVTDNTGRAVKRRATGKVGVKCESRMNIKIYSF